jgi:phosphoribosyl 1,2-cyclic phosphodiesterase
MERRMRLKLWGVRGSLPAPVPPERMREQVKNILKQYEQIRQANVNISADAFLDALPPYRSGGYGGHTSCAEITHGSSRLILDAGSGIRNFSDMILSTERGLKEFHIYFTHFHWDHLIGLPFFTPLYSPGVKINMYAAHDDFETSIKALFRRPNFPVPFSVIEKQMRFHKVDPRKPFNVGELSVTPYKLDHPDPCWGARIEAGGRSIAWAVDSECTRTSREELGEDYKLYHKADLMVFDAQYSFDEAMEKINWGHSSGPIGIDLAIREQIKKAVFVHHDPGAGDDQIHEAEEQTMHYYEELVRARKKSGLGHPGLQWHFAQEGEVFEL